MAATYELIASNTLSSSAATVTFSSIPATYTDLVLKITARSDAAQINSLLRMRLNGVTASEYSRTRFYAVGSDSYSERNSNQGNSTDVAFVNGSTTTSDTFANIEIYIPSYLASANKPISSNFGVENNSTTENSVGGHAYLWRNTTAINEIRLEIAGADFVSGSSFFLYGIKNS